MTPLTNVGSFICLSLVLLFQNSDVIAAASFHAVDCNVTTSQEDFQYASNNGQSAGTMQVNDGTVDVFQQLNGTPTWVYYRFLFNVTNGNSSMENIPATDKVVFEINFTINNRTLCKLFHINNF